MHSYFQIARHVRFASLPIPVASFAAVVGIVALGLDWRATGRAGNAPPVIGESLIAVDGLVFVALIVTWLNRIAAYPNELRVEFKSPITASLFGTIVISTSLLSAGVLPYSIALATVLWIVATISGLLLLITLLGRWIETGIESFELTPALYAPVVGNATTAYAGVALGFGEIGWLSYAVALFTWLTIGPIVVYRLLVVVPRLPRKMAPQLGLLVSSPAVLAGAWHALTGHTDVVFKLLAFNALFLGVLVVRLWRVGWGEPFNVAMWGWTFPTAALAGAFGLASRTMPEQLYRILGPLTLAVATVTVGMCAMGTVRGWFRRLIGSQTVA
jgi:tellurite resistance protein